MTTMIRGRHRRSSTLAQRIPVPSRKQLPPGLLLALAVALASASLIGVPR